MPNAGHTVIEATGSPQGLVADDGALILLTGMDSHGGYGHREQLDAEAAGRRLPDPAQTRRPPQTQRNGGAICATLRLRRVCG